ncbi:MAG: hypothetical protein AAGG50_22325 [Bacteroidota bacterium]
MADALLQDVEAESPHVEQRGHHLWLDAATVARWLGDPYAALVLYNGGSRKLWIAPATDDHTLSKFSTTKQLLLKHRTAAGDRTLALHEVLLDHQLPPQTRTFNASWNALVGCIEVTL